MAVQITKEQLASTKTVKDFFKSFYSHLLLSKSKNYANQLQKSLAVDLGLKECASAHYFKKYASRARKLCINWLALPSTPIETRKIATILTNFKMNNSRTELPTQDAESEDLRESTYQQNKIEAQHKEIEDLKKEKKEEVLRNKMKIEVLVNEREDLKEERSDLKKEIEDLKMDIFRARDFAWGVYQPLEKHFVGSQLLPAIQKLRERIKIVNKLREELEQKDILIENMHKRVQDAENNTLDADADADADLDLDLVAAWIDPCTVIKVGVLVSPERVEELFFIKNRKLLSWLSDSKNLKVLEYIEVLPLE